nr:hypothetical protein [Bacteroidaceae bacterium]
MRFSTIRTHKEKGQALNTWTFEKFIESIQVDVNKGIIFDFRRNLNVEHPERFYRFDQIAQVSAAVELKKQPNGAISVKAFNGLVVLEVRGLMSPEQCRSVKLAAMETDATLAAFIGATGQEVIILVKVAQPDGSLPATEADAEDFYIRAYHRMARIYDATLPKKITRMAPTMRHMFLRPFDMEPEVNTNARPYPIRPDSSGSDKASADEHLLSQPEQRQEEEVDMTAYMNYERAYERVAREVADKSGCRPRYGNEFYKNFITGMATALCRQGWPQEEVICHLWNHLKYKDWPGLTEQFARTIVDAVYAEEENHPKAGQTQQTPEEPMMQELIRRLESHYTFRFNTIMGYAEYRPMHTWPTPWRPLSEKAVNTLTTDLQLAGMNVWNRDVRRYVHSTRIQEYNPIEHYLLPLEAQWDKRDHIRALAATVPTTEPALWAEWFHTWFLAMVAQWLGRDPRYGNSIVPLLISPQGMHKSAFCRQLLPPELRSWGYTDNLSLAEERPVHLAMAQMLLINLDEFNRISP